MRWFTQVVQSDAHTLCLRLRARRTAGTPGPPDGGEAMSAWLWICWEPVHARLCMGPAPPRGAASEAYTFGNATFEK